MNITKNPIAIFEQGNPKNPAVVFIHGFPFDHRMWDKITDNLEKEFYCITYDIRGLGFSGPGDGQYTMEDLSDDLFFVLDKLKLNNPVVCGLSMGGYIALRAVERNESKFRGLILCDTKSAADTNESKISRAMGIQKINSEGAQKYIADFVPGCFAPQSIESLGEDYISILGASMNYNAEGLKGCLLAMAARTDTTNYLNKIKIPVLILCGEKDTFTPPPVMKEMSEKIKNSQVHIVPCAGHMSPVENSEFVLEKIREFLR